MRLFRPGPLLQLLYPDAISRIKTKEKKLVLTFDDGPHPLSTPVLIDILYKFKVRSIFFCDGRAAEYYPDLVEKIKTRNHIVGNHGYHHLNGWKVSAQKYLSDVALAAKLTGREFFRPPYGRITPGQYRSLKKKYRILFWDIMAYDFDISFGPENSLKILKKNIRPGSIIVLHDSPDSCSNKITSDFIEFAFSEGYTFIIPAG